MFKSFIDQELNKLKHNIPVNQELKRSLRQTFAKHSQYKWRNRFVAVAAIAAVVLVALLVNIMPGDRLIEKADAASLKIGNQISFIDIGGGYKSAVAEYNGILYFQIEGKGLFAYDKKGIHKIFAKNTNFIRVASDGKQLVLAQNGDIDIFDIPSKTVKTVLKGEANYSYGQPSWSSDNKQIIFTKHAAASGIKGPGIYSINLITNKVSKKLADGYYPAFVKGKDAIVFEKDNRIVYKNLKDGSEKVIDDGRYPCVSPDGEYVSYVKASPQGIENVWIADLDFAMKRQVTVNFSKKSLNESNPVDKVEQTGLYSYYEPVWSSDSSSLYVIKNQRDIDFSRLMRIDFTAEKLTAEDTVKRFTQALIVRDEDYARSLMKTPPPGYLTVSNPHYVGYEILKAGNEKNKTYVDAEMHLQYTANPYYQIVKCRFYLSSDKNGYIIDSIEKQGSIEVMELENDKTVKMNAVGKETVLFKESDIPAEYLPSSPYRIASLVYNEPTKTVYFSLQLIKDENNHSAVKLLSYSLPEKKFRLLDQINYIAGNRDVVISQMAADFAGEFLTVDLFSESDPSFTSHTLVYNLKNNQKTNLSDLFSDAAVGSTFSSFWDGSDLYFNINGQGQTMKYIYNAQNSILNSF